MIESDRLAALDADHAALRTELQAEMNELKAEYKELKDEIKKLKGEKKKLETRIAREEESADSAIRESRVESIVRQITSKEALMASLTQRLTVLEKAAFAHPRGNNYRQDY